MVTWMGTGIEVGLSLEGPGNIGGGLGYWIDEWGGKIDREGSGKGGGIG